MLLLCARFCGETNQRFFAMKSAAGSSFLDRKITFRFVLVLAIVLFALTNLPWHLDDYDQAKQAFTSFEMVKQGHWIYQHTPNGWVATKPPLVGWISAALFSVTRSWELAWRLPSFLAGLALLVLIGRAAIATYGRAAALIAVCAFGLNLFAPRLATLVRTDMPFALIVFVIGWLIWEKIRKRELWNERDRLVVFALLSVAMLIKGPIVYAFLLPGIVAFAWRARATGEAVTAWCGWWPWLASLAIFLAWVIGGILFRAGIFRARCRPRIRGPVRPGDASAAATLFLLPHLLHRFAPWSILLILLPVLGATAERLKLRSWMRAMSPETFWLVAWSLGGLLVMSFVPSKRVDRVFPIVPPLCLLLAAQLAELQKREKLRVAIEWCCVIAIGAAGLFATGSAVGKIVHGYRQHRDAFVTFGEAVRKEAREHGWRYAIVGGEDEGMLLYLRCTEFIEPEQAVAEWNGGAVDGLVVPDDELADLIPRLRGAVPSRIGMSGSAGNYGKRYIFLVRS